jgi:hypothetical protein
MKRGEKGFCTSLCFVFFLSFSFHHSWEWKKVKTDLGKKGSESLGLLAPLKDPESPEGRHQGEVQGPAVAKLVGDDVIKIPGEEAVEEDVHDHEMEGLGGDGEGVVSEGGLEFKGDHLVEIIPCEAWNFKKEKFFRGREKR